MKHRRFGYGWIPDLPDRRDQLFRMRRKARAVPRSVDLRTRCPVVYDQGQLGSCTANAIGAAVEFNQRKQRLPQPFTPSRLFIYYNERALEGTLQADSGAMLRDGIKSVASQGTCPEPMWPYVEDNFAERPTSSCYKVAKAHPALRYNRLSQDVGHMKACLADGYPFVFGFTVYESFEREIVASSGVVPMPDSSETVLGGHAVMAVGYDDSSSRLLARNSWGTDWGMGGYFTIPYAYVADNHLADDFWTIRLVK